MDLKNRQPDAPELDPKKAAKKAVFLTGAESITKYKQDRGDFITIQAPQSLRDPFEEGVRHFFYAFYHILDRKKPAGGDKLTVYPDLLLLSVPVSFITALAAAIFPVISILALFFVKKTLKRIYTLIGLTVGFAIAVKLITRVKTRDLFAITAA